MWEECHVLKYDMHFLLMYSNRAYNIGGYSANDIVRFHNRHFYLFVYLFIM